MERMSFENLKKPPEVKLKLNAIATYYVKVSANESISTFIISDFGRLHFILHYNLL